MTAAAAAYPPGPRLTLLGGFGLYVDGDAVPLAPNSQRLVALVTGDEVEVDVELDTEPRVAAEPADFARALDADLAARTAYDRLPSSRKRQHVLAIDRAKKAETRKQRIETALATLRDQE